MITNIDDPNLRVYIVWVPTLRSDSHLEGVVASNEFKDKRLSYFWDSELKSGKKWAEVLDMKGVAWDVYFLYGGHREWTDSPGQPDYFMHQLGGLPRDKLLKAETLKAKTRELLSEL